MDEFLAYTLNLEDMLDESNDIIERLNHLVAKLRLENACLRAYVDELEYELYD